MTERICATSGCTGRAIKRQLCNAHYQRLRKSPGFKPNPWRGARPLSATEALDLAIESRDGCWLAKAVKVDKRTGYAQVGTQGRTVLAHRLSYETYVGPIPKGLVIDHVCRVRHCVNPKHLEVVTYQENTLRSPIAPGALNAAKTHCPQGHEYSDENTRVYRGFRYCKRCQRARAKARSGVSA